MQDVHLDGDRHEGQQQTLWMLSQPKGVHNQGQCILKQLGVTTTVLRWARKHSTLGTQKGRTGGPTNGSFIRLAHRRLTKDTAMSMLLSPNVAPRALHRRT